MKLQLNENTLNAYINEAIRQEINEGIGQKVLLKGAQKAATKQAGKTGARAITHSPLTKKFFGNIKDAKSARKFIMGLKRGKVVSGTVESGNGARGVKWFTKDGKTFFKDAACKQQITDAKELRAVRGSFKGHYTAAANLFNSAQRNMLGTAAVAGLGTGWAIDHAKHSSRPDDPWNEPIDDQDNDGSEESAQDNGFPWDNTEPQWTPKPTRKPQPQPQPAQEEPQQPERRSVEPLQPVSTINIPTGVTGTSETLPGLKQRPESFVDSARRVMAQTAAAGLNGNTGNPKLDNWKQTNRNTRRTANAAIDTMRRDGAITRNQARQDKRAIKDTERTIRRNAKEMQNQGQ